MAPAGQGHSRSGCVEGDGVGENDRGLLALMSFAMQGMNTMKMSMVMSGERIPAPSASNMSRDEVRKWHKDMAKLDADPRTRGNRNRPAWLVRQAIGGGR